MDFGRDASSVHDATMLLDRHHPVLQKRCIEKPGPLVEDFDDMVFQLGETPGLVGADGEVLVTFPSIADHVIWVVQGSETVGLGNAYGDPGRGRTVAGGMPGWGDVLTKEELLGAVLHERARLSGSDDDVALAEAIDAAVHGGTLDLGGHFDPVTITTQEIDDLLASASGDDH